ncbi:SAV_915 family protein [Streptomyces sp. SCSIO ZS0520]|uniref:SAV_915 family protein n=1 Tax=Streptomyces sp. SCSIO ZS0520 TaxID=2892996 RepID=UPI0021DAD1BC|nr:SAV_915 family protein [Streptomyces sp. SCSIO ZS0520]
MWKQPIPTGRQEALLVLPTLSGELSSGGAPGNDRCLDLMLLPAEIDGQEERLVALAFTRLALLVEAMGTEQTWVVVPAHSLGPVLEGSGVLGILVDPAPAWSASAVDPDRAAAGVPAVSGVSAVSAHG